MALMAYFNSDGIFLMQPGYSIPEGLMSLYQPDGGLLTPEKIIKVGVNMASRSGVSGSHRSGVSGSHRTSAPL